MVLNTRKQVLAGFMVLLATCVAFAQAQPVNFSAMPTATYYLASSVPLTLKARWKQEMPTTIDRH